MKYRIFRIMLVCILFGASQLSTEEVANKSDSTTTLDKEAKQNIGESAGNSGSILSIKTKPASPIIQKYSSPYPDRLSIGNSGFHPLSCPPSFDNEGIYIWCDPDGVWTIFWRNCEVEKTTIRVFGKRPISLLKQSISSQYAITIKNDFLEIKNIFCGATGLVQFSSPNDSLYFIIDVDGSADLHEVYIGHDSSRPASRGFSLKSRKTNSFILSREVGENMIISPSKMYKKPKFILSGDSPTTPSNQEKENKKKNSGGGSRKDGR